MKFPSEGVHTGLQEATIILAAPAQAVWWRGRDKDGGVTVQVRLCECAYVHVWL